MTPETRRRFIRHGAIAGVSALFLPTLCAVNYVEGAEVHDFTRGFVDLKQAWFESIRDQQNDIPISLTDQLQKEAGKNPDILLRKTFEVPKDTPVYASFSKNSPNSPFLDVVTARIDDQGPRLFVPLVPSLDQPMTIHLGELERGIHTLEMKKTAATSGNVQTANDFKTQVFYPQFETYGYEAFRRCSPLLGIREDNLKNLRNDAPLIMFGHMMVEPSTLEVIFQYGLVLTSEDDGHTAESLVSNYKRDQDVEWVTRIKFSADRKKMIATYQAPHHTERSFAGKKQDSHTVLRISSKNNNFDPTATSSIVFAGVPRFQHHNDWGIEIIKNNPILAKVTAEELEREGISQSEANRLVNKQLS